MHPLRLLQLKRHESLLTHLPSHVLKFHKSKLLSSPLDQDLLFGKEALDEVLKEVQEDSSTSANVSIATSFALPSFASVRAAGKASSSAPQTSRGGDKSLPLGVEVSRF